MARILVVDDRPTNRQMLLTLLGYTGHELIEAGNGADALELVRSSHPDLVISDILMPTMDGYEFVRELRADPAIAATPVIFYTATFSKPEAESLAHTCGVSIVLPKPCDPGVILAAVEQVVGRPPKPMRTAFAGRAPPTERGDVAPPLKSSPLQGSVEAYTHELQAVQAEFEEIARQPPELMNDPRWLRETAGQFSANATHLQRLASRLSAVFEVGMVASAERDPERLLKLFFGAVCDIVTSDYAAVGMLDEQEQSLACVFAKGVDTTLFRQPGASGVLSALLAGHTPIHACSPALDASHGELPDGHPPVRNFLGVAVKSAERVHGWLYFGNRTGAADFDEEDERMASLMAGRLALMYENAMLYDVIQRHAAELQLQIVERHRAAEKLRESELRLREISENINDVFYLVSPDLQRMLYVNSSYERIWGRPLQTLYDDARTWTEAIHPDDRVRVGEVLKSSHGKGSFDVEYRIVRPDGDVRWIKARSYPVLDDAGQVYRVAGMASDITAAKAADNRIRRLNRVYSVLSGINALLVRVRDRDELFRESCRIAVEQGHFLRAWIGVVEPGKTGVRLVATSGNDEGGYFDHARKALAAQTPDSRELKFRVLETRRPVFVNHLETSARGIDLHEHALAIGTRAIGILPIVLGDAAAAIMVLHAAESGFFDDEETKLLEELAGDIGFALDHLEKSDRVDYLAYYDVLTGLANRALFSKRLEQYIEKAAREHTRLAVVLFDIDRFRHYNDAFGRHAGDDLLKQVAARCGPDKIRYARLNADNFAVILPDVAGEESVAKTVLRRQQEAFGPPFKIGDQEVRVAVCAGIALYPDNGETPEVLVRNAEAALKQAKKGSAHYLFYEPQMNHRVSERLGIENRLRQALEKQQFVLHYQPKVSLETNRINGMEALIRWNDPAHGLLPPVQFISILEETGMILEVGAWVMQQAIADIRRWESAGLRVPRVAVNVSPIQLQQADFLDTVRANLALMTVTSRLDIEITESVLMEDIEANIGKLRAVRAMGVGIAIDDFGTGYSSLAYLARLPVGALKIDRSFVVTMLESADVMTLVSTIITLARALNLKVIAEGVDDQEQARILRLLRCDEMQGYLFSKPIPFEDMSRMLAGAEAPS
ncbi:MAG: EAL domain-containing protein [Sulfuritalea sp.]|nr:EAL domain-containing protein [Sulfuritalea sp.]